MATTQATFQELKHAGSTRSIPTSLRLLGKELERQRGQIELIASENFTWPSVLEAVGSVPTNKYAEGYPGRRYYGGCEVVDEIEQLAIDRAKELFGAEHANVQPHAGAQTNMAVYAAVMEPGDTLMALRLDHGGHLTHGHKVNFSGRLYSVVHYGVSPETMTVDYDDVLAKAKEARPKVIVCGGSAYPRTVETDRFRAIADEVGALLLCDMAHFAGLVAAGPPAEPGRALRLRHLDDAQDARRPARRLHPLPRGAREGGRLGGDAGDAGRPARAHDRRQGDVLPHRDDRRVPRLPGARPRATQTCSPRRCSTAGLALVTGGTDTHLMLVDLRDSEWTGKEAEERLHEIDVTVNRNTVPFDERSPFVTSGIRLGTPAMTMRGFDEDDFREIGRDHLRGADRLAGSRRAARPGAGAVLARRPLYEGFRGYTTYVA